MNHSLAVLGLLIVSAQPLDMGTWLDPPQTGQGLVARLHAIGEELDTSCKINLGEESYPLFRQDGNNWLARLPSTPLTEAGTRRLRLDCPDSELGSELTIRNREFPLAHIVLPPSKTSLSATETEKRATAKAIDTVSRRRLWQPGRPWLIPNGSDRSSAYGERRTYNGVFAEDYFHQGIDFAAEEGEPVWAPAGGKVILAGDVEEGFLVHGNCLFVNHGQGLVSSYLHLSEKLVQAGDQVYPGQVIGRVGTTGISTGPHLHFGLYLHGKGIDPNPWFSMAGP